ncbi:hypothetical protein NM688_g8085 [Phlebia brevispora]|uniref:Uncharacterized protein n=1 Tax=Phlebia brevispora TaxID=194682 RepID=A0ACC1RXI0_9APHY|nr:hypothetical protein NM688_g8085 [Phlebia brevispora]
MQKQLHVEVGSVKKARSKFSRRGHRRLNRLAANSHHIAPSRKDDPVRKHNAGNYSGKHSPENFLVAHDSLPKLDPVTIIQTALTGFGLTGLTALLNNPMQNATANMTSNGTLSTMASNPLASGVSPRTILSLLLSFSALRDWLKLIVIGGTIETCRRMCLRLWHLFIESFWISACFNDHDESYNWVMFWLSKHPKWQQARMIDVTTRSFGLNSPAILVDDDENAKGRRMCYLPSLSRTYSLWYKGHYISVTRTQEQESIYSGNKEVLRIDIFARSHSVLNTLLLEAKKDYHAAEEHLVSIYVSESARNGTPSVAFPSGADTSL